MCCFRWRKDEKDRDFLLDWGGGEICVCALHLGGFIPLKLQISEDGGLEIAAPSSVVKPR